MKVITVCGSLKFVNVMMNVAEIMELKGNCVITPIYNPNRIDKDSFTKEELEMLSKMHFKKIEISDSILVIDFDGYIGNSTQKEIDYAKSLGKEVMYYSKLKEKGDLL